ncbi:MAG: phytoene desaturase family protein [Dehalococcoidia bacterium]
MEQTQYDAIIIGSGHNGLTTAGYLARDGLSVLVLERQDVVGGAAVTEELYPGFLVPYCSYICYILQGKVIDDLELREYGLEIIPTTYGHFHPFPDGQYLQIGSWGDLEEDVEEIARFSERDARAYPEWRAFWEQASGILHRYWLKEPPTLAQVFEDVRGTRDEEVWETMLTVSQRDLIDRYFESEYVKSQFIDPVGEGDPSAPGSIISTAYELCAHFSRPEDIGIPRGSMGAITQAMARSAQARGVEIRTGTRVEKVIVEDGVAKGVKLANGEEIRSFIVVSNADPKSTYLALVDSEHLGEGFIHKVKSLSTRGNCVKFLAALKELPDFSRYLGKDYDPRRIAEVTICPSVEYCQDSWDAAKNGRPSEFPIMDVQIPSIYDPSLAPPGHHVFSAWCRYYPAELANGSWEEEGKRVGDMIIDILTGYAPNFRDSIIDWTAQTPKDIEVREGMTDGNIRHIDINSQQIFTGRMPYRSPIDRLYMCGSGTHPGGDVTGAPGHNAAKAVLKDLSKVIEHQPVG